MSVKIEVFCPNCDKDVFASMEEEHDMEVECLECYHMISIEGGMLDQIYHAWENVPE